MIHATAARISLALAALLLGVGCQGDLEGPTPFPHTAPQRSLSKHDLSRDRKPGQSQQTLFPGVTVSADETVTAESGEITFTGHVFCDSSGKSQVAIDTASPEIGWPLYATAQEAVWNPISSSLELRGRPAIQFPGSIVQALKEDTVITLSPSQVNTLGPTRSIPMRGGF